VTICHPMQSKQGAPVRRNALFALFVLSGVGGLSLEVVWTRQLAISLGSTSRATTAVVALFMAGLALGNSLGARRARGLASPVRNYGFAEVGVALGAALCTLLLPRLEGVSLGALRYVGAALLMLAPTVCMGVTWPLLTESWRRVEACAAGRLYAANTLGAAAGALLTGFVAIGLVGVAKTGYASALIDLVCGALALAIGDGETPADAAAVDAREGDPTPRWFLAVAAASGFLALAEEIVWTRALLPYVNSSTYAFAAILGLYLLGLAGGSWLASRDLRADVGGAALSRVQLGLALSVAATPLFFALAERYIPLYSGVRRAVTLAAWGESVLAIFIKTAVALAVPTVLLGANTAFALRVATAMGMRPARAAGAWGSANTLGAIVGTVLAGFVLLPVLGAHRAISLCAAGHLALALVWRGRVTPSSPAAAPCLAVALAVAALVALTPAAPFTGRLTAGLHLLLVDEGPQDTTAVVQTGTVRGAGTFRAILSNGVAYASDNAQSRRYMGLLGHLPALLADDPSRALVICVGTGTTARAVAVHPEVRALTLVDISPVVHRTLPLFAHVNGAIWKDRRVRIVEADGRQYLSQSEGSFGLITLEPPPPRMAGAASLYTRELYARARRSLVPGGVLAQWLPLHGMTADETWMLVRTFLEEFPDGALFVLTPDEAALVGGASPFRPDVDRMRARLADPTVTDALRAIGFRGATPDALTLELLALSPTHGAALRALAGRGVVITDDRPMIEQFAIGLARSNARTILSTDGRASLFDALGRTTPSALPIRGAAPDDLARALLDAQARYRAIR
jgi:spermidine synthase